MTNMTRGRGPATTGRGGSRNEGWSAEVVRALTGISLACGLTIASVAGCGAGESSSAAETASSLPPEVAAQLGEIERLMNGDRLAKPESVFDGSARIQLAGRLAYGSLSDFVAESTRGAGPSKIEFEETEVISRRPDRIRTVTRMAVVRGEERSIERITHEWVPDGDRWIAREQSYPDWSPLVGDWVRSGDDGEEVVGMRLLPNGQFEMRLADSEVVTRAGTYAVVGEIVTIVPDAIGAGAAPDRPFDLRHRFEFDGSLRLEREAPRPVRSAGSDSSVAAFEGDWRRRRAVD